MDTYDSVKLECVKRKKRDEIKTKSLAELGFPVDVPALPDPPFPIRFSTYYSKIVNTPFYYCNDVRIRYIQFLLETGDRETAFRRTYDLLSPYGITVEELIGELQSGGIYTLSAEDAARLSDEFAYIIETFLPEDLSKFYESFNVEPHPAYSAFFDMAAEQVGLTDKSDVEDEERRHRTFCFAFDRTYERMLAGESFLQLYETTCDTKQMIHWAFERVLEDAIDEDWFHETVPLRQIELALFDLSRAYRYRVHSTIDGIDGVFDFVVSQNGQDVLAVDYLRGTGNDVWYEAEVNRKPLKALEARGIPYLVFDENENRIEFWDWGDSSNAFHPQSVIRAALKDASTAARYREQRKLYLRYGRAAATSAFNGEEFESASVCGCYSCEAIFSPQEITDEDWDDFEDTVLCPRCHNMTVIMDSQQYTITPEYLAELKRYMQNESVL